MKTKDTEVPSVEKQFCIVSDGSCDLPEAVIREKEISVVHFLVSFDGIDYRKEGVDISLKDFYQQMVDDPKTYPKSAAPSPEDFYHAFVEHGKLGQDILCVCISTKLSAAFQSAQIAKRMFQEEYPDIRVEVVDSLCATLMQGAFVLELCKLRDAGCSMDTVLSKIDGLIKSGRILFTVGNLDYLQHGGRIGKVTSLAGTLLDIKPLITLQEGEIHSSGVKRGRKKSLEGIVELLVRYYEENHCTPNDCTVLIGYCHDEAEGYLLQKMTMDRLHEIYGDVEDIPVCQIGATIGVHAGPYSIGYGLVQKALTDSYEIV